MDELTKHFDEPLCGLEELERVDAVVLDGHVDERLVGGVSSGCQPEQDADPGASGSAHLVHSLKVGRHGCVRRDGRAEAHVDACPLPSTRLTRKYQLVKTGGKSPCTFALSNLLANRNLAA